MTVAEILRQKDSRLVAAGPETSMLELAALLRSEWVGCAVISGERQAVEGLITERDFVIALTDDAPPDQTLAAARMRRFVVTCSPEDDVIDLAVKMIEQRLRHVPVVQAGRVIGLISQGDVLKHMLSRRARIPSIGRAERRKRGL